MYLCGGGDSRLFDNQEGGELMKDTLTHILGKLSSGRWILTVLSGVAFLYCVWKRILPPEAITAIITSVFVSYFNRNDRKLENGKGGE